MQFLQIEFIHHGDFDIETFATGELCKQNIYKKPDIVILDFHLDGIDKSAMNGLATLDKIKEFDIEIPVIILSSQDKIEVAVDCMRHQAFDYVIKSETAFLRLQKVIETIFKQQKLQKELNWYMDRM